MLPITLRQTPFYRRRGVAELTQDDEEEQVKVSVCVCRWVIGEGWISAKVAVMVARQQHVLFYTSLSLR